MYRKYAEASQNRARIYRLLSNFYIQRPSRELIESLAKIIILLDADGLIDEFPREIQSALRSLRSLLEAKANLHQDFPIEMSAEYTRLFRGIRRQDSPLPPYESLYREGVPFGDITNKVSQEYRQFGLDLGEEFRTEPPDHIAFELYFMSCLCDRVADFWRRNNIDEAKRLLKEQNNFLRRHLIEWVQLLSNQIKSHDRLGIYENIADLTESWIRLDYEHLERMLQNGTYA